MFVIGLQLRWSVNGPSGQTGQFAAKTVVVKDVDSVSPRPATVALLFSRRIAQLVSVPPRGRHRLVTRLTYSKQTSTIDKCVCNDTW